MIKIDNVSWQKNGRDILKSIRFNIHEGEMFAILGPNGSGKTSLLSLIAGLELPSSGKISLNGQSLSTITKAKLAQQMALVEQHHETELPLKVQEVVQLGRTPYLSPFMPFNTADYQIIHDALAKVDMSDFYGRDWHTLSGGEKQRLQIARAFCQQPQILLLDEPTNHLDIRHQLDILHLVKAQKITVIVTLHDLNHAARFCDRIAILDHGKLVACGAPKEVLTQDCLRQVFQVETNLTINPEGHLHIDYLYSI